MRSLLVLEYILLFFFFLIPFHAFGVTFINHLFFDSSMFPPSFLLGWKEGVLTLLFGIFGIWGILNSKKIIKNIDTLDTLVILFSVIAGLLILWKGSDIKQVLLGVKYDLFFIWVFFVFRHFPFRKIFLKRVVAVLLCSGAGVMIFAGIQYFSSAEFLIQFGYFNAPSVDTIEKPASFCQLLEGTDQCRLTSTFAGPIRFGGFLVLFSGLILWWWNVFNKTSGDKNGLIQKGKTGGMIIIISLCLFFLFATASRGAWIAEIILFFTFFAIIFRIPLFSWKVIISGFAVACLIIGGIIASGKAESLLIREGSTTEHWQGITESISIIVKHPEGMGLGTAGPASSHFVEFLNENWYLQIFTEMGGAGGIIFLILVLIIHLKLWEKQSFFFPIFCALSVMALFTHLWEESALAYSVWAIAGLILAHSRYSFKTPYS